MINLKIVIGASVLIIMNFVLLMYLLYGVANATYDPILQNRINFNSMLTTYPELRDANIKFVPTHAEALEFCENGKCKFYAGSFNTETHTIFIRNKSNPFKLKHYIFHEYGHLLYRTKLNKLERKVWEKLFLEEPNHVSDYSRKTPSESFAEWTAIYKYGTRWHRAYNGVEILFDSPQAKFIDQYLK